MKHTIYRSIVSIARFYWVLCHCYNLVNNKNTVADPFLCAQAAEEGFDERCSDKERSPSTNDQGSLEGLLIQVVRTSESNRFA